MSGPERDPSTDTFQEQATVIDGRGTVNKVSGN